MSVFITGFVLVPVPVSMPTSLPLTFIFTSYFFSPFLFPFFIFFFFCFLTFLYQSEAEKKNKRLIQKYVFIVSWKMNHALVIKKKELLLVHPYTMSMAWSKKGGIRKLC